MTSERFWMTSQDFNHFKMFSCCCCFGFGLKGPALVKVGKCPPMLTWPDVLCTPGWLKSGVSFT